MITRDDASVPPTRAAYLASGALSYVIQRLSRSGAVRVSLAEWQAGRGAALLSFPAGTFPAGGTYDMTAPGQAIWAEAPAGTERPWMIWRWSGGAPAQIAAFPLYGGVDAIAW